MGYKFEKYSIGGGGSGSSGAYVLDLSILDSGGEFTDEQWAALEQNAPNVIAVLNGQILELIMQGGGIYAFACLLPSPAETGLELSLNFILFNANDKTITPDGGVFDLVSKTYVDEAVAGAGGSGGSGGSAPNIVRASDDIETWFSALEAWMGNNTDCVFEDTDGEACRFVSFALENAYFLKGSTKQLIVVTIGESVSIQYVGIGGNGGGVSGSASGMTLKTLSCANFDAFVSSCAELAQQGAFMYKAFFEGSIDFTFNGKSVSIEQSYFDVTSTFIQGAHSLSAIHSTIGSIFGISHLSLGAQVLLSYTYSEYGTPQAVTPTVTDKPILLYYFS